MKQNDSDLRRMFVQATDDVIPPAPWLETHVAENLHGRSRQRSRALDLGALRVFGPSLRLTAALVALLLVFGGVAGLLMTTRLHLPTVPGGRSTTLHSAHPFIPSPAVRAANWPPGERVPGELAGSWQTSPSAQTLYLAVYSWQVGDGTNPIAQVYFGNVVVNGSQIDFMSDFCKLNPSAFGFESFTYALNGDTLVITRASGPGQSNCSVFPRLAGTYSRAMAHTFTPSPAVRASSWPPGGAVPSELAGAWQPDFQSAILHMGAYTWELGDEPASGPTLCGPGHCFSGNVVVNGWEIDFIDNACTQNAQFGFERFQYALAGNTLVLTRMQSAGQSNCNWLLAGTYSRVS